MGAWSFIEPRLRELFEREIAYAGRDPGASTAVGALARHKREQACVGRRGVLDLMGAIRKLRRREICRSSRAVITDPGYNTQVLISAIRRRRRFIDQS